MTDSLQNTQTQMPEFGSFHAPSPQYNGRMEQTGFYLTMRDGVRIAVELYLPADRKPDDKLPAIIVQTRYWRATQLRLPFRWLSTLGAHKSKGTDYRKYFTGQGYAVLIVDVRGTGASFGAYPHPWSKESFEDAREIVDWIVRQSWSNGSVGTFGVSYGGTSAEFLALLGHPAVKVAIPKFNHPDSFLDISHPGGEFNERFIKYWGLLDKNLDNNVLPAEFGSIRFLTKGVKPVDEDRNGNILRQAIQEHSNNGNVYEMARQLSFRDEHLPGINFCTEDFSVHKQIELVENSPTQIIGWGSWMDAGTADAVLRRFLTFRNAAIGIIGAWDHGGNRHASPFLPPETPVNPLYPQQLAEMLHIFDVYLKNGQAPLHHKPTLYYYTMGEEKWKVTSTWPPQGFKTESWYLDQDHCLTAGHSPLEERCDEYVVDFEATTGKDNIWWEMGIFEKKTVMYPDRAEQEKHLLSFTTTPLQANLEISGYPIVTLWVSSDETDGNFFVYLEDVAPNGRVTYITEGHLRAIHRHISSEKPPYKIQVPFHTYKQKDACPLIPGEVTQLRFGLNPTSVLIRKGHCLRISIAGHDEGTFTRNPAESNPTIRIYHSPCCPSCIDLPVLWRGEDTI